MPDRHSSFSAKSFVSMGVVHVLLHSLVDFGIIDCVSIDTSRVDGWSCVEPVEVKGVRCVKCSLDEPCRSKEGLLPFVNQCL